VNTAATLTMNSAIHRTEWAEGVGWEHSGWLAGSAGFVVGTVVRGAGVLHGPAWTNLTTCIDPHSNPNPNRNPEPEPEPEPSLNPNWT
jgi:hypothetical protein